MWNWTYSFAIWALLLANSLSKPLQPKEPVQFCFYAVYQGLSPLNWSENSSNNASKKSIHTNGQPSSSLAAHSTKKSTKYPCINVVEVTSLYASAKEYCSDNQVAEGIKFWKKMCKHSNSTLMDLADITAVATDSYVRGLGKVDPDRNKSSKITEPSLLSKSYFDRAYRTIRKRKTFIPDSKTLGWVLMGYWGAIVFLGILTNLFNQIRFKRHETVTDMEGGSWTRNPGKISAFGSAVVFWLRTHLIIPATIGAYHNQTLFWSTIPKRLDLLILSGFWAMTMILSCVKYDVVFEGNTSTPNFAQQVWQYSAKRTSVLAYALLPWIWMFAGRNNIFIWATGWSFRTFNIFHRHIARATTLLAIYHGIAYTITYVVYAHEYKTSLEENWFKFGIVAVVAMSILVGSSNGWIRAKFYDFFLVIHIVLAILTIIALFVHSSKFDNEYDGYLWAPAAIWCFDRFLRMVRIIYCNIHIGFSKRINRGNSAVATYSKATEVIRVDIKPGSSLVKPGPGQSYYLYEPLRFKWWECHPLSLGAYTKSDAPPPPSSSGEKGLAVAISHPRPGSDCESSKSTLTFWIRPYTGWTRRLRDQCLASPSLTINPTILLEGPYGHAAPLHTFDTVMLIVGGTGISTAVPYIMEHIKRAAEGRTRTRSIKLVWAARQSAFIYELCRKELSAALQRSDFEGMFWASRDGSTSEEKDEILDKEQRQPLVKVNQGRPDVQALVVDVVRESEEIAHRTVVLACGPGNIADEARAAVHVALKNGCCHLEYVEEAYGW